MNQHIERLDGLAPFLFEPVNSLITRCDLTLHRTLLVVYGWRSMAEQAQIFQRGRVMNRETGEWDIVNADLVVTRAQVSGHNVITQAGGMASVCVDLIPLHSDGSADWNPGEMFWERLYEISWKLGLDPLGDPIGAELKGDRGHFEEPGWKLKLSGLGLLLPVSTII